MPLGPVIGGGREDSWMGGATVDVLSMALWQRCLVTMFCFYKDDVTEGERMLDVSLMSCVFVYPSFSHQLMI